MVEMHPDPGQAKSDAAQALSPSELESLSIKLGVKNTAVAKQKQHPQHKIDSDLDYTQENASPAAQRSLT